MITVSISVAHLYLIVLMILATVGYVGIWAKLLAMIMEHDAQSWAIVFILAVIGGIVGLIILGTNVGLLWGT